MVLQMVTTSPKKGIRLSPIRFVDVAHVLCDDELRGNGRTYPRVGCGSEVLCGFALFPSYHIWSFVGFEFDSKASFSKSRQS